ncbi:cobalamin biosynthesis protein [Salinisphaera sp. Q1T1-3]|uniref:cobalamin biosynthesis protein n=1 Tax=Salinisphaera sp. Q1T1-3 TaxID=2321229 RepID=UPI000E715065|nr:cobalamin biosynthesis protein [Salinisphaera sp. Q1T1-3]RJS95116.1 cobalamin biosynthesis protein CobE [Salinisphaera sp. Q1T1-3]
MDIDCLALGVGCRPDAPPTALIALVEQLRRAHGLDETPIAMLATIDRRRDAVALRQLARHLGCPVQGLSTTALAGVADRVLTRSPTVAARLGVDSVAEAAALVAASVAAPVAAMAEVDYRRARLLGPRLSSPWATAAFACFCGGPATAVGPMA